MASPALTDRDAPVVVTNTATIPQRASRLPGPLRFAILLALNSMIPNTIWSILGSFVGPEIGAITVANSDDLGGVGRVAFRLAFLVCLWQAKYDWVDVSSIITLATIPYAYLIVTYYGISHITAATYVVTEVLAVALPTLLLRPRSKVHNPNASLRNRFLLESFQVQLSTALLATGVYVTVLWCGIKSGLLNSFLVSHFDLTTVENAYKESPISITIKVGFAGIAARTFLLNSSLAVDSASGPATPLRAAFDPVTATLSDTIKHNFWFFSKRNKSLIRKTAILSALTFANTVQRTTTLRDSDWTGSFGYAGLWVLATAITSAWWAWIGDTEA